MFRLMKIGTIDKQYLGEFGIDIYKDMISGGLIAENINKINFAGEFIQSIIKENDTVKIIIGKPIGGSHFNSSDGEFSSKVILENETLPMIMPDARGSFDEDIIKMYGKSGSFIYDNEVSYPLTWNDKDKFIVKSGIKKITDIEDENFYITFKTENPISLSSKKTYFIIKVFNANNETILECTTSEIDNNYESIAIARVNNRDVRLKLTEFTEQANNTYSVKPEFTINIGNLLGCNGGGFSVEIIHVNDLVNYTYKSDDLFLNTGLDISADDIEYRITSFDVDGYTYCSGLKYLKRGQLEVVVENIDHLNKYAIVDTPIKFESDLTDEYTFNPTDITNRISTSASNTFNLAVNNNNAIWGTIQNINIQKLNNAINNDIKLNVSISNAFSTITKECILNNLLVITNNICSNTGECHHKDINSNDQIEYFVDESKREDNNFSESLRR